MAYYKLKTAIIEARQLLEPKFEEISDWCGGRDFTDPETNEINGIVLRQGGRYIIARFNDWVLFHGDGRFTFLSDEVFHKIYEGVS